MGSGYRMGLRKCLEVRRKEKDRRVTDGKRGISEGILTVLIQKGRRTMRWTMK